MATWLARAKVNLVLDVVGMRPDGYHELATIFQSIELADVVTVEPAADIDVSCETPGIPAGPENLAFRAAALLRERAGITAGARIVIDKHIPAGAGLGGGSADAAATLVALNELWALGLSAGELAALGLAAGSDVPFMIAGGTCIGRGRGELLTPLAGIAPFPIAVVVPPVAVATAGAYRAVDEWPSPQHPDLEPALAALRRGDLEALARSLGNTFEAPIAAREPVVAATLGVIRAVAPRGVVMSGSGSALIVVGASDAQVEQLRSRLPGCFVWSGRTASAGVCRLAENKPGVVDRGL
ncbi:MAG: 4-(cytidine 5'-diphospho)-2-C-methyl-D-erythritol kinase [Chloroflexota bacterium]